MIAGLEETSRGQIMIGGRDATAEPPSKRGLAMVFQSYALYPHMSVRDNVGFPLKSAGLPAAEIKAKVDEAARVLKLDAYLDRRPKDLSGGQRQRVAIGRSIVRDPDGVPVRRAAVATSTPRCASRCATRSPSCTRR